MAIEFFCPGCGKLMRTPDKTGGKKGQCPFCQTKVQIPEATIAAKNPNPVEDTATIPAATKNHSASELTSRVKPPAAAMLQLKCPACERQLSVPTSMSGKKGKCPGCGSVISIQGQNSGSAKTQPKQPTQRWKGAPAGSTSRPTTFAFSCSQCAQEVRVAATSAGKRGKCPHCQAVIQIPNTKRSQRSPAAPNGLTPQASPFGSSGLTPLDDTGLTPLNDVGLGSSSDLFGSGSAGNDPFADLGPVDLGSLPSMPNNYAPSGQTSYGSMHSSNRSRRIKPKLNISRDGLPWERENKPDGAFISTVKLIVFSPNKAFCKMKRSGGVGAPLGFAFMGVVTGTMIYFLYVALIAFLFFMVSYLMLKNNPPPNMEIKDFGQVILPMVVVFGVAFGVLLVQIVVGTLMATFLGSGIHHLLLLAAGGANESYETTYRVTAYSFGATTALLAIPIAGAIVQPFAYPVITILGLKNAHETSGLKASVAVLLPYCLIFGLYLFAVVVAILGRIAS